MFLWLPLVLEFHPQSAFDPEVTCQLTLVALNCEFEDLWVQVFSVSIKRVYLNCFGLQHFKPLLTASI